MNGKMFDRMTHSEADDVGPAGVLAAWVSCYWPDDQVVTGVQFGNRVVITVEGMPPCTLELMEVRTCCWFHEVYDRHYLPAIHLLQLYRAGLAPGLEEWKVMNMEDIERRYQR